MRRLLLLAALLTTLAAPTAVMAGTCPTTDEGGVVEKDTYRLGELIDLFGTYHDFADPGTVTVSFERTTDGAIRQFTAFNLPDGSWDLRLTFESVDDIGRWAVTVVVDQTDALDTCTDVVTIRARSAPDTATEAELVAPPDPASAIGLALLCLATGALTFRRVVTARRDVPRR